jgi:hypothetical protein
VTTPDNTTATSQTLLVSHFRGRKLLGRVVTISSCSTPSCIYSSAAIGPASTPINASPSGFEGAVLLVAAAPAGGDHHERPVTVWDRFSSFTSWEHDREPTAQDTTMINKWLVLSSALHQEVV